jgi:hypothetical protein
MFLMHHMDDKGIHLTVCTFKVIQQNQWLDRILIQPYKSSIPQKKKGKEQVLITGNWPLCDEKDGKW